MLLLAGPVEAARADKAMPGLLLFLPSFTPGNPNDSE